MKFTLSWLKDHLDTSASLPELTAALVDIGLEVESVEDPSERLQGFVIADVVSREKHPNADRLSLCQVDDGSGALVQVVCGAPNVRQGMKAAFARVGQVIPVTGEALKKGRIRDVDSNGMLCSARELLLGEDSDGILDLSTNLPAGTPLTKAFEDLDPIIELAITPNRGDCFGVRGIARDLSAKGLGTLKPWPYQKNQSQKSSPIKVTTENKEACPYFVGRLIKGVKNGESPSWVQNRLKAIGLRPISALVDMTNYLTYDLGRPLHVFDAQKIQGNLNVRLARSGEKLLALNEKTYELDDSMIVVADDSGPLALGGIMGGVSSGCTESTQDVFIEAALFDSIRLAHTGRKLNIISDARTRLERGVDPAAVMDGVHAATEFVLAWCGGEAFEIVTAGAEPSWQKEASLTQARLKGLSGCDISLKEAQSSLEKLGFEVKNSSAEALTVQPPSWRNDIEGEADLIEEVMRMKGFDEIKGVMLSIPEDAVVLETRESNLKRLLAMRGFFEIVTWSFISEKWAHLFGAESSLMLANPISQDMNVMRSTLLPGLLEIMRNNQARGQGNFGLFEVGHQYLPDHSQVKMISGVRVGDTGPRHWAQPPRPLDVFDAKAHVLALFEGVQVSGQLETTAPGYYHPGRSGTYRQGPKVLAHFGELHPKILRHFDLRGPVVAFEVFLDAFPEKKRGKTAPIFSPYQAVERDFAFVLDATVPADNVVKAIQKVEKQLIESISVFDVYEGDKIEVGKKSLAIQVRLQPKEATLTDVEIQATCDKIIESVRTATGGTLRQ